MFFGREERREEREEFAVFGERVVKILLDKGIGS
jgi:hypothetical protein